MADSQPPVTGERRGGGFSVLFSRAARALGLRAKPPADPSRELQKVLLSPGAAPPEPMREWSMEAFDRTPDQLKHDLALSTQWEYLLSCLRDHPVRTLSTYAILLFIIVLDLATLIWRFDVAQYLAVTFDLGGHKSESFFVEKRESSIPLGAFAELDEGTKSAIIKTTTVPLGEWEAPPAMPSSQYKGILSRDESESGKYAAGMSGLSAFLEAPADAGRMGRTLIREKEDKRKSPYGPAYEDRDVAPPEESKIKLNRAFARLMGASGQIAEGAERIQSDGDFRLASSGDPTTPSDPHGTDWQALIDEDLDDTELMNALTKAIEGAQWKTLHKAKPGEIRPTMGLAKGGLKESVSFRQLFITQEVTREAADSMTDPPENRINKGRATYFGERY